MISTLPFVLLKKTIIIGASIFGIGFIIGFHELGHFMFGKLFNTRIPSFSIGFGPKLFSKKIGETLFSLSAIPLGGYVEMATTSPSGKREDRLFERKPFYQKFLIISGGILFNMIFSYFIICTLFAIGLPKTPLLYPNNASPKIASIEENSVAAKKGLKVGDIITKVDETNIDGNTNLLVDLIKRSSNKKIKISVKRNKSNLDLTIPVTEKVFLGKKVGSIGTIFTIQETKGLTVANSIKRGIETTNRYLKSTALAFLHIFRKKDTSQMAGPIMIVSQTMKGASQGIKVFFLFLAIISINLAVLNILPLPILDTLSAKSLVSREICKRHNKSSVIYKVI